MDRALPPERLRRELPKPPPLLAEEHRPANPGWWAKVKSFFGITEKPYAPREGDRISFRNWYNAGSLSNGRITKDEGHSVTLTFFDPWRGTEEEVSVPKGEIYRPIDTSLGHVRFGDRVSIPAPFWRRQDGTVMGIQDDRIQVGFWEKNGKIRYEWVSTNEVGDPKPIEEKR